MKSSQYSLEQRGYLPKFTEGEHKNLSTQQKLELLESSSARERTLGARLLAEEKSNISNCLIKALILENKLYSKIEICKSLVAHKSDSTPLLIAELGRIGTNQHKKVPDKEFKKDSYPLPRDIVARTLATIGKTALPQLLEVLENKNKKQIHEAIDAVGFICFYDYQPHIFEKLENCYSKNNNDDLLRWKIIRAMSSFPESLSFLLNEIKSCQNQRIIIEIKRSIRLLEKREIL